MENVEFLDFLVKQVDSITVLNCSSAYEYNDDLFEQVMSAYYCDADIDLGVIFLHQLSKNNYLIIDGKRRFLSLMLLLKAFGICHETLSPGVSIYANHIDNRYLKSSNNKIKLELFGFEKTVYEKIINAEPLSYNEKQTEIYQVINLFKDNIEHMDVPMKEFYELFDRIKMKLVITDGCKDRDLFYSINKSMRSLNQLMLIKSYFSEVHNHSEVVDNLYFIFGYKEEIFVSFMKAYLSPKFNCMIHSSNSVYDYFVKYVETIKKYQNIDDIISGIIKTAKIYKKMYNAEYTDSDIRNIFINIAANKGRDTFAYLLELCEDYENKYLEKDTLLEICKIVNTYSIERQRNHELEYCEFSQIAGELNKVIYQDNTKENELNITIRKKL